MGLFDFFKTGLKKTREGSMDEIGGVFRNYTEASDDFYDELEEAMILADMGMETATDIVSRIRKKAETEKIRSTGAVFEMFRKEIADILRSENPDAIIRRMTNVLLVIGVNGAGKTTTIGKMAHQFKADGMDVVVAAADTFRAAAIDQLRVWAERAGVTFVAHDEGSDPGAVVYDAADITHSKWANCLLVDTAGRLQNKKNLMEELRKINRILENAFPTAHREVLLVLDATTGQNALSQAKLFKEVAPISGIVLTKMDGSAKGGVVVGIMNELHIPVKYIGFGEGIEDLRKFDPDAFAAALFDEE
ncbi:MAG: signal recognition particle-docking protein FtsY [Lachnospiraceae bacterium]|nr:signal recognition particle-docking protein FtsY [Lachnospiraceae bacterium]